ncbi:hypothetical protein NITHO_1750005 [Nitrolancea hollandica Lb]|uniref:Uncharacterized protein n=1 Tax=Nitrolancea hollandica Lb TaxID=1129897 RepID=I4EE78_9BACT|nr:hypothetical protein NITHO_1750005 [Nitrolancea hollandica Lb]
MLDLAEGQEHQDEDHVNQRDRRLEEVVIVAGDELPQFIDKGAEPDAADDRRDAFAVVSQYRQRENERREHQQSTPQHVGDVQPTATELRVAGRREERPDHQDGSHGRPQYALQIAGRLNIPNKLKLYRSMCGYHTGSFPLTPYHRDSPCRHVRRPASLAIKNGMLIICRLLWQQAVYPRIVCWMRELLRWRKDRLRSSCDAGSGPERSAEKERNDEKSPVRRP